MEAALALVSPRSFEAAIASEASRIVPRYIGLNVFHRLSVGTVLLDRFGKVLFANATAQAMSRSGGPLRLGTYVRAHSSAHSRRLGELISSTVNGTPPRAISIAGSAAGRAATVVAVPVDWSEDEDSVNPEAILLIVFDPGHTANIPESWVMEAFGLTGAEAKVALAIAAGNSVPNTSRKLKVSINTVKTHLSRIYQKMGIGRQAELSRVVTMMGLFTGNSVTHGQE